MATYAVMGRIDGVRPRRSRTLGQDPRPAVTIPADDTGLAPVVQRPIAEVARERWERSREIWSQTTFYLFDPSSWR